MVVCGVDHKTGEFNGKPWDNYYLYVVDDTKKDGSSFGVCPTKVKVSAQVMHQFCSPDQIQAVLKQNVDFYYDAYKNVCKVFKI